MGLETIAQNYVGAAALVGWQEPEAAAWGGMLFQGAL